MIRLSNGHEFEYTAASGALAFDGQGWLWEKSLRWLGLLDPSLFTVVIKTLTFQPRKGNLKWPNPFGCIRFLPGGVVNAVNLTNPGIKWWCQKIGPKIAGRKISLVGSIFSDSAKELAIMARMLNEFDLKALEINVSCPNSADEKNLLLSTEAVIRSLRLVAEVSKFPLILKLSVLHDIEKIVPAVENFVEAFSINSVPWPVVFPYVKSPLEKLGGGGVSGQAAQKDTWPLIIKIRNLTKVPVIGPSVWEYRDLDSVRKLGAKAISFGSIFLRYPWRPTLYVRRDMKKREVFK